MKSVGRSMNKKMEQSDIDFVLIWVDDTDVEWQKSKAKYKGEAEKFNINNVRYRDWGTLKYWFRAVEKYAPWVRKIHFVTCGHVPKWLNLNHPKLNFVKHEDYIPKQYLPTFSANPIELNLHRIKDLADKFVFFNDDYFINAPVCPDDFFKNGLPCDAAILNPQNMDRFGIPNIVVNDLGIIEYYFEFKKQFKENISKWINLKYGKLLVRTMLLLPWMKYVGFYEPHLPNSFLKQTYFEVWKNEKELLEETSSHKFRDDRDVNQWLMRYWQLAKGDFVPRNPKIGRMFSVADGIMPICNAIDEQKYKLICINDSEKIQDIGTMKDKILKSFDKKLKNKSRFEW